MWQYLFCPVVQTADTAPYHALFATFGPSASAIQRSTFTANQTLRQSVLAGVGCQPCGSFLLGGAFPGVAPCHLCLHRIKGFAFHDAVVMILKQIHRQLTGIADNFPTDAVADVGLLQENISAVFFVGQNASNGCDRPLRISSPFFRWKRICSLFSTGWRPF